MWWLWWWLILMFVLFLIPAAYGWGYRGSAPPYPSWTPAARARGREAAAGEAQTWGFLADFIWLMLLVPIAWIVVVAVLT